jgi:hypothetical protein
VDVEAVVSRPVDDSVDNIGIGTEVEREATLTPSLPA